MVKTAVRSLEEVQLYGLDFVARHFFVMKKGVM